MERVVRERWLAPVHALRSARRRSARRWAGPLQTLAIVVCYNSPPLRVAAAGCRNKLPRQRRTPTPPVRSVDLDDDARTNKGIGGDKVTVADSSACVVQIDGLEWRRPAAATRNGGEL